MLWLYTFGHHDYNSVIRLAQGEGGNWGQEGERQQERKLGNSVDSLEASDSCLRPGHHSDRHMTDCGLHWAPDYERQWPEPGSKSPDNYDFLKEKLDFSIYCICQLFTLFGKFWATLHMQFKNLIGSAHTCSESPSLTGKSIIMAETNKQASKRYFLLFCPCPYENGWWTGSWI